MIHFVDIIECSVFNLKKIKHKKKVKQTQGGRDNG